MSSCAAGFPSVAIPAPASMARCYTPILPMSPWQRWRPS
ncbi:predicted protein [Plenodomus lingam JN3]|uniref:Predicted protein n=1 Tax=Leptosphaeria maculans (strain JN3 / isolate v23.1.3 / race Av1-4-5-6-7-8) TaxID=985895 RepID=E5R4I3_LEPMJ|nr:predicted protein [Plenodomus lingam JN3]CBX91951.1 predicted protein [Plenodomus lingam JN3]